MSLKTIFTTVISTIKSDETKAVEFVKAIYPEIQKIVVDVTDILKGVTPPTTGNKIADDILKVLSILAPYYPNNTALIADVNEILTFLEGAESVL